jgi:hypothetical protein
MNKKKLIIAGSLLVVVGIGGYFGYQWYVKNKKKKEEEGSKDSSNTPTPTPAPTPAPAPAPAPPPPTPSQNTPKVQPPSNEIRFKVGESVKTNKPVVVTPFRIVDNKFVRTGEPNKTLTAGTSLKIARAPFMLDGNVTYRVNPFGWLGVDEDTFYTIYQQHLQIA